MDTQKSNLTHTSIPQEHLSGLYEQLVCLVANNKEGMNAVTLAAISVVSIAKHGFYIEDFDLFTHDIAVARGESK